MINICTHSDKNYLAKGLALYKSIIDTVMDFNLWYLCTDEYTYKTLLALNLDKIKPIYLGELEKEDELLQKARNNPPSKYGDAYSQFCWTLTPYFTYWLLHERLKINNELIYVDADIYFYESPQLIIDECKGHSVGIHRHRFTSYDPSNPVGEFNVGVLYFKNNFMGREIAKFWKNLLLYQNNPYYNTHGTCGDQKYLDLFIPLYGEKEVHIFDHNQSQIAHGAPWNFDRYQYNNHNQLVYEGNNQRLIFNHFSHFTHDFEHNTWKPCIDNEWHPDEYNGYTKKYYDFYWEQLKKANQLIIQQHD